MKSGALAAGALLLILGFFIFWSGYSVVQQYSTSLGQLALAFSSQAQEQYQLGQLLSLVGGVLAFGGLAACIYGAAAKSPERTRFEFSQTPYQPTTTQNLQRRFCPNCGATLSGGAMYCPGCGQALTHL